MTSFIGCLKLEHRNLVEMTNFLVFSFLGGIIVMYSSTLLKVFEGRKQLRVYFLSLSGKDQWK